MSPTMQAFLSLDCDAQCHHLSKHEGLTKDISYDSGLNRQSCQSHGSYIVLLTPRDMCDQVRAGLLALVGGAAGKGELGQCAMCQDIPEDPVVSACGHPFCKQCISAQV